MSKYHGKVGYATNVPTAPGVWEEIITEHDYYGDVVKNRASIQQGSVMSAGLTFSNNISIVGDAFAYENFYSIRYVTYLGKKWNVTSVEIERPRLILTIGGIYNEQ